jgi:DUF1707 SHOCT-like domain
MCHHSHHHHRPSENPHARVGDQEREQAAGTLRRAAGAGLLDVTELEQRLTAAWSARTRTQLGAVTADLRDWTERQARTARRAAATQAATTTLRYMAATIALVIVAAIAIALA